MGNVVEALQATLDAAIADGQAGGTCLAPAFVRDVQIDFAGQGLCRQMVPQGVLFGDLAWPTAIGADQEVGGLGLTRRLD